MSNRLSISQVALRSLMGAGFVFASFAAFADVLLQLQRLSDTDALLVGSGSLGMSIPAENQHALYLIDPFSIRPSPLANNQLLMDSDLHAGSFVFNFANDAGSGIGDSFTNNYLYRQRHWHASFRTDTFK